MLNNIENVFERLLSGKLEYHQILQNSQHLHQYGFKKGKSTVDAINYLMKGTDNSNYKYLATVYIDTAGAFANLWWSALFKRLTDINCPEQLCNCQKSYMRNRYIRYKGPRGNDIQKMASKGCPQGSVLGPHLWNLVMDDLLSHLDNQEEIKSFSAFAY